MLAEYTDPAWPTVSSPSIWMAPCSPGPTASRPLPAGRSVAARPCIKVVGHSDPFTIATLRPLAVERFGHALYVTQTSSQLLELLHPRCRKGRRYAASPTCWGWHGTRSSPSATATT